MVDVLSLLVVAIGGEVRDGAETESRCRFWGGETTHTLMSSPRTWPLEAITFLITEATWNASSVVGVTIAAFCGCLTDLMSSIFEYRLR